MPKGRHLKPDFFTDKHIVSMSPLARLLYQGLWCYSADCGHLDDEPVEFKLRILPADNCDIEELLGELSKAGRIKRADGQITIPTLREHGRIDKRYETECAACKARRDHGGKPAPDAPPHDVTTAGTRRDHDVTTRAGTPNHDADGDGDGDGELMVKGAAAGKPRKKPSTRLPDDWQPTDEHAERCVQDAIDLNAQAAKFRAHAEANDRRQVNWNAAFTQWLLNVPEWQRGQKPAQVRHLPSAHDLERPPDGLSPTEYAEWERGQREKRRRA